MRTTLNIEDDVYFEAQNIANAEKRSIGSLLSDLVRRALQSPERMVAQTQTRSELDAKLMALGVAPYYAQTKNTVSNAQINKFKEELEPHASQQMVC